MSKWLVRGLVFAVLMVVVRLAQGVLINTFEAQAGLINVALLVVFAAVAVGWGLVDGRRDAKANPDPDRREDLPMIWLLAGLFAGVVSGAVCSAIALFYPALYVAGVLSEVTSFAAFTTLVMFVPAVAAAAVGRYLVDRNYAKMPQRHHGLAAEGEEHHDTDVFAAVGAGAATAEADGAAESLTALAEAAPGFALDGATEQYPAETAETTEFAGETEVFETAAADEFPTGEIEEPATGEIGELPAGVTEEFAAATTEFAAPTEEFPVVGADGDTAPTETPAEPAE